MKTCRNPNQLLIVVNLAYGLSSVMAKRSRREEVCQGNTKRSELGDINWSEAWRGRYPDLGLVFQRWAEPHRVGVSTGGWSERAERHSTV
jgi:hypothetical protein